MSGKTRRIYWLAEWLPAILARTDLTFAQKAVAAVLAIHADNESGECWPSQAGIVEECGGEALISLKTISRATRALSEIDALVVLSRGNKNRGPSRYRLRPVSEHQSPSQPDTGDWLNDFQPDTGDALNGSQPDISNVSTGQIEPSQPDTGVSRTTQGTSPPSSAGWLHTSTVDVEVGPSATDATPPSHQQQNENEQNDKAIEEAERARVRRIIRESLESAA